MSEPEMKTETAKGATETAEPTTALRRQGRRAAEAKATVPATTCSVASAGPATTGALVAALASALRVHPEANASYRDAAIDRHARVNVGVVVADGDGSTALTIHDADTKAAAEIDTELADLTALVRDEALTAPQTSGATCSATDLSAAGVSAATPVLIPPHAVAIAAGCSSLTLAYDLRVLSPFKAAALLTCVHDKLESGTKV